MAEGRLLPRPDRLSAPYWDAVWERRLRIQRCRECSWYIHLPEALCPRCGGGDLGWDEVSGRGTVHTFSVVHRTFAPGFADRTPYVIAWIDLVEQAGLRAFGNVLGLPPTDVRIGLPVRLCFQYAEGFGVLPNFQAVV